MLYICIIINTKSLVSLVIAERAGRIDKGDIHWFAAFINNKYFINPQSRIPFRASLDLAKGWIDFKKLLGRGKFLWKLT